MSAYVTAGSAAKFAESQTVLAGGVASSLRAAMKPVPLFAQSASGTRIRDDDGNEYIDYLLAYGPLILGHAHPGFNSRLQEALQRGATYGLQHDGEIALAKRLTEILPAAEKVALSGSGTEAVMLALRIARAYTGKRKIVRFHGHYHGWSDTIFTSFPSTDMRQSSAAGAAAGKVQPGTGGQSEVALDEVILLPWNDLDALETALRADNDIAVVISEPVMCNSGCIMPKPGYLERIRELTKELGIVMILDEVITGFRVSLGGAHGRFGLKPDLVTVGKALGCGIGVSAVVGSRELMALVDNGTVSHLGTLNGNCVATAAALATLGELSKDGIYEKLEKTGNAMAEGIRKLLAKHGMPSIVNGIGPVFHMMFTDVAKVDDFASFNKRDAGKYVRFAERMLEEGVLIRPNGLWYVSTVHTEADVEATLAAIDRALDKLS
jgi:glutamate-1-semialdehyde 2,1-aminomutase